MSQKRTAQLRPWEKAQSLAALGRWAPMSMPLPAKVHVASGANSVRWVTSRLRRKRCHILAEQSPSSTDREAGQSAMHPLPL